MKIVGRHVNSSKNMAIGFPSLFLVLAEVCVTYSHMHKIERSRHTYWYVCLCSLSHKILTTLEHSAFFPEAHTQAVSLSRARTLSLFHHLSTFRSSPLTSAALL